MNTKLHNLSTSSRNPIKLGVFSQYVKDGWSDYTEKRVNIKIQ